MILYLCATSDKYAQIALLAIVVVECMLYIYNT